jgi:TetR/AcrR family transcriptional regulator, transcriptional repressor for nem operon
MGRVETREELIRVGKELIARQGFSATGIDSVVKTAGVPKGSFYYYFSSKEDFGLAVIDDSRRELERRLKLYLQDVNHPALLRIRNYLEHGIATMKANGFSQGCLIGNLGQELASQNEMFRTRLENVFQTWKRYFVACFEEARCNGEIARDSDVTKLADFLLIGWEGAVLRCKMTKSVKPMRDFIDIFFDKFLTRQGSEASLS